ncbi:UNVERIFIED_CONTAM: hypothetical protein PYX00_010543 [Menopon gallinae]|uniref:Calcineurin-like phosphoesterase domain-containing protein n=1 Tax=Menopon gallinae TaxID=328185 RepID=A0AAW2HFX4_9NEOP
MEVHALTNKPTAAWKEISKTQKFFKIKTQLPNKPVEDDKVRIVCMSDTHSVTSQIKFDIPDGDIFLHAGDFTSRGLVEEVIKFSEWIGNLPHKYKIVIAGNHELSFDPSLTHPRSPEAERPNIPALGFSRDSISKAIGSVNSKSKLTNCIYLEDSEVVLYGIKFYGTPWQPEFHKWAFNLPRGECCLRKWNLIPSDTDVLITHTPPIGHGDLCCTGVRAGCVELLSTVQKRVKPKYHVFGHIHEGHGITSDGKTIFVNASTCDILYRPMNPPIVFDVEIPKGIKKSDWLPQ